MKKALVCLALLAALSLPLMAGPTLGIGLLWQEDAAWLAPSIGIQWLAPLGVETNLHFAMLDLNTNPGGHNIFDFAMHGFWEIFTVTSTFMVDQFRFVFGVGTPFDLVADATDIHPDTLTITGTDLSLLFGFSLENASGSGIKGLAYYNGATVGVIATAYVDLFPAVQAGSE